MPILELGNKNIYYEIFGEGPIVILHHGFSMWADDWIESGWVDVLSKSFKCLLFDATGHGRSSKPRDIKQYTVEERTGLVLDLANNFGWTKFSFVGFSMGGRPAYELLSSHSERLHKVVILAMHGYSPARDSDQLNRRIQILRSNKVDVLERALGVANYKRPANNPYTLSLSTEALLSWKGAEKTLGHNKIPTQIVCGEKDPLYSLTRDFSRVVASSKFLSIPDETHGGMFYRNQQTKKVVLGFLK